MGGDGKARKKDEVSKKRKKKKVKDIKR